MFVNQVQNISDSFLKKDNTLFYDIGRDRVHLRLFLLIHIDRALLGKTLNGI